MHSLGDKKSGGKKAQQQNERPPAYVKQPNKALPILQKASH